MSEGARNKQTVRRFFDALAAKDADAVAACFAPEGVHRNPYHSGLFPAGAEGRAAVRAYWVAPFQHFGAMRFELHALHAMEEPRFVFASFAGHIETPNGAPYENLYYATFRFDDRGQILEYVEIFNPIVAARAFGRLEELVR